MPAAMRVALVACRSAVEGPWTPADGSESAVKVTNLGEGEHVELRAEVEGLVHTLVMAPEGVFPIPFTKMQRYRIVKKRTGEATPRATTVEVILNGTT